MRFLYGCVMAGALICASTLAQAQSEPKCKEWRSDVSRDVTWDGITGFYTNAGIYVAITDASGRPQNDGQYLTVKNEDAPAGEFPLRFNQGNGVVTVGAGRTHTEPLGPQVWKDGLGRKVVRVHFTYCRSRDYSRG